MKKVFFNIVGIGLFIIGVQVRGCWSAEEYGDYYFDWNKQAMFQAQKDFKEALAKKDEVSVGLLFAKYSGIGSIIPDYFMYQALTTKQPKAIIIKGLDSGIRINSDYEGCTWLMIAAQIPFSAHVNLLIKRGAALERECLGHKTALCFAAENGYKDEYRSMWTLLYFLKARSNRLVLKRHESLDAQDVLMEQAMKVGAVV
jgi:hypothetical protein